MHPKLHNRAASSSPSSWTGGPRSGGYSTPNRGRPATAGGRWRWPTIRTTAPGWARTPTGWTTLPGATSKSAALRRLALAAPAAHLPRGWGQEHLVGGRGAGGAQYEDTRRDGVFQDGAPVEWWSARRTMTDLGYGPGESLRRPLAGGRAVCDGPGFDAGLHFVDIVTLVPGRRGQPRGVPDTLLSRFGVVVTILNGDMAKPGIARTQRYFYERTAWAEDNGSPVVPPPFLR